MIEPGAASQLAVVTIVRGNAVGMLDVVAAMRTQSHEDWSWDIIVGEGSTDAANALLTASVESDERISIVISGSSTAVKTELDNWLRRTNATLVVFLGQNTLAAPSALTAFAHGMEDNPAIDLAYADNTIIEADGDEVIQLKPDWSPERLRHHLYFGDLVAIRTDAVRAAGGFGTGSDGAELYDLVLRIEEQRPQVAHLSATLSSTIDRGQDEQDRVLLEWEAGRNAVENHLQREGIEAFVAKGSKPGFCSIYRAIDSDVSVSVIISTRGRVGRVRGVVRFYVVEAVRSILATSRVGDLEVIVVHEPSIPKEAIDELRRIAGDALVLVPFEFAGNFGLSSNKGFLRAHGDFLVFAHDDIEFVSEQPLEELISPLAEAGVGITGARLLSEQMNHDHAGVTYGASVARSSGRGRPFGDDGSMGSLRVNREVSALSGIVAVARETFVSVGGYGEDLPSAYADIDLSLKIRAGGSRAIWLQNVILLHFDAHDWDDAQPVPSGRTDVLQQRWGALDRPDDFGLEP